MIECHDKHNGAKNCLLLMTFSIESQRILYIKIATVLVAVYGRRMGGCCIAGLNFVIFAVDYNFAEGVCDIVRLNYRMKFQRRGCADCDFLVFFPTRFALYECIIQCIYMFRCISFSSST